MHQYVGELYYKGESDCGVGSAELRTLPIALAPKLFRAYRVPCGVRYDQSNPLTFADHDFVLAEQHLLAAGKRDAAKLLAEMMFEWCVRFTAGYIAPPGVSSLGGCPCPF